MNRARTTAVEISFDAEFEARIQRTWTELRGCFTPVGTSEVGVRPHVSLAVFREGEPAELQRLVAALAAETRPFRLEFVGVDAFRTSEGVVFLEPAAAQELTHVHRRFTHLLGDDAGLVSAYYREDLWRPHCTVATGVPAHAIEEVIERCRNARVLSTALVRRMSITAYGPATSLLDCELEDDRGGRRP